MSENTSSLSERSASDEELMQELAEGRTEALGMLHARYAALIFSVSAQTIGRDAAEEIVQEVFLAIWRKAHTFDPARGTFRAWVLRIAHLRVLNELRRRSRRPRIASEPEGQQDAALAGADSDPVDAAWRAHRRAIVRDAVNALPAPQRQALSLAFLDDLTHEQVAAFLNLPLGTAKSRIRAGLQSLRTSLAPLLAAGLAVVGLLVLVLGHAEQKRLDRALRLVTSSDVAPLRLVAGPGVPQGAHGTYRGRPGVSTAVMTFTALPTLPEGRVYRVWMRVQDQWTALGTVPPADDSGRALLIIENPVVAHSPEAVWVTLEPRSASPSSPGAPVIMWPDR